MLIWPDCEELWLMQSFRENLFALNFMSLVFSTARVLFCWLSGAPFGWLSFASFIDEFTSRFVRHCFVLKLLLWNIVSGEAKNDDNPSPWWKVLLISSCYLSACSYLFLNPWLIFFFLLVFLVVLIGLYMFKPWALIWLSSCSFCICFKFFLCDESIDPLSL